MLIAHEPSIKQLIKKERIPLAFVAVERRKTHTMVREYANGVLPGCPATALAPLTPQKRGTRGQCERTLAGGWGEI